MAGADKPLLRLGDRPVLAHVLERLRPQVGPIALSANGDPARFAEWGLTVLPDLSPDRLGPLAGVLVGMLWARPFASHVLSWPGDTPYPPVDLVARLAAATAAAGGVTCATSGGRVHPVVALWPVVVAERLRDRLRGGRGGVAEFARSVGLSVVAWADDPDPFTNLNTPADLHAAQRALSP